MAGGGLQPRQKIIRFGEFELDFSRQVVSRNGVRLKLQKQPFLVLALLIQRAPEVVSRDEIQRHVWGEDVYVDVEQSINFCIRHIRGLLLDSATNSRFIQTVPREGYRFIAQLEHPIECQDAAEVAVTAANPVISGPAAKSSRRYKRIVWIAITGLAIIAVLFWRLRPESVIT